MLTIFSTAKPFTGPFAVIQTNAISSWCALKPQPEIILFGDETGTEEIAHRLGLRHISHVQRNEYGTILVNSLFEQAQAVATNDVLCYVNADTILTASFERCVKEVRQLARFLIVGRRWSLALDHSLDVSQPKWEEWLKEALKQRGIRNSWDAIEYFVFPRGQFRDIPPFAFARTTWDNWLIYHARARRIPVVDASDVAFVVHQDHDYSHHPGGWEYVWNGPEAKRNRQLAEHGRMGFCIADATHVLTTKGVKPALAAIYLWRRIYTAGVFHPVLAPLRWVLESVLGATRRLRIGMGLELSGYPRESSGTKPR